jgi:hypothetical protein
MNKYRFGWIISLILSFIFLVIGASFHNFRAHPSNEFEYNLGVNMGIIMISLTIICLISFIVLLIWDRHNKNVNIDVIKPNHISDESIKFLQVIVLNEMHLHTPITNRDKKAIIKYCKQHYGDNLINNGEVNKNDNSLYTLGQEIIKGLNNEDIDYINAKLAKL